MSHQALARKWRPKIFDEISGQQHVTRTLQNAIRLGRIHHAFLLTGARGVGKTSAARILARALNCEQGPAENPCNECGACTEMLAGTFPDLLEIDAASHNSVDDIRDLVEKVQYTPQRGRYKVYVIDEVHMVTKQGFNALLKTLEEPPAHVVFILATTDPQQLLDTVVSRCQRFDFKMIPVRTIYERLKHVAEQEGVKVPDASLKVISREGGGSMRDAQSLLDQVLSFSGESVTETEVAEILGFIDRSILYAVVEAGLGQNPAEALEQLARVATFGYDVRTFANQLLETVRNVALVAEVNDAERLLDLPDDEIVRLKRLAGQAERAQLAQQFDILAAAIDRIAHSEQPMLLLEMAVLKIASVRPLVPLDGLLLRLEALERKIGPRPPGAPPGSGSGPSRSNVAPPATSSAQDTPGNKAAPQQQAAADIPVESQEQPAAPAPMEPDTRAMPEIEPPWEAAASAPVEPQQAEPAPATSTPEAEPDEADSGPSIAEALSSFERVTTTSSAPQQSATAPQNGAAEPVLPDPAMQAGAPDATETSEPSAPRPVSSASDAPREAPRAEGPCNGAEWRQFVHELSATGQLAPLCAVLSRGTFLGSNANEVHIGFQAGTTLRQARKLGDNPTFLSAAQGTFGPDVLICYDADPEHRGGPSLAEELQRIRSDHHTQQEQAARDDQAVQQASKAFPGAQIESIQVPELKEIDHVQ